MFVRILDLLFFKTLRMISLSVCHIFFIEMWSNYIFDITLHRDIEFFGKKNWSIFTIFLEKKSR